MPVQEFVLDQAGTQRVQVFQDIEGKSLIVLENQRILGSLTAQEAVDIGRVFALSDGSTLKAQIVNGQIQVQRNSQILTPVSISKDSLQSIMPSAFSNKPDESVATTRGKRGGCLTTYLVLALIGAAISALLYLQVLSVALAHDNLNVTDPPLWYDVVSTLYGLSMGVGIIGLFRWKRWGYYLIVGNIIAICIATLLAGTQFQNLGVVIGLAILTFLLRRKGKWAMFA